MKVGYEQVQGPPRPAQWGELADIIAFVNDRVRFEQLFFVVKVSRVYNVSICVKEITLVDEA